MIDFLSGAGRQRMGGCMTTIWIVGTLVMMFDSRFSSAYGGLCEKMEALLPSEYGSGFETFQSVLQKGEIPCRSRVRFGEKTVSPELFTGPSESLAGADKPLGAWPLLVAEPVGESQGDLGYSKGISHFSHVVLLEVGERCFLGWYRKKSTGPDSLELTPVLMVKDRGFSLGSDLLNPACGEGAENCNYQSEWTALAPQ